MRDLIEYIVKNLVNNPDAVLVEESEGDGQVNLLLHVDPADMGMVIGRAGQTIKAIRRILTIRAVADNVRVNLELADSGRVEGKDEVNEEKPQEEKLK